VLEKITYAGVASRSFAEASTLLAKLAELPLQDKQVERVCRRIGAERVDEREAQVAAFQALPLAQKFAVPSEVVAPELAVVMVDGGRLQIRADPGSALGQPSPEAARAGTNTDAAETWEAEAPPPPTGHWREDKVGLLLTMNSAVADGDPCPEIPPCFVDATRIPKLVRELKKNVKATQDAVADSADPEAAAEALVVEAEYKPPQVQQRRVVASRQRWPTFAPLLATAARAWGFQGATRRAFVGDGSANNWTLQHRFFASFVPILDFIHALSYVFAAAFTGRSFAVGWACYEQWIQWVWQGQVAKVIAALKERQLEVGLPADDDSESSPAKVVEGTLRYLQNQQDKMRYDEYRQRGLPITSSHIESVVKQINQRVKGTEKFWSEDGSEAILQLRADYLSDGEPLQDFWQRRQLAATGQRPHRRTG
jgi:hypothetical protein